MFLASLGVSCGAKIAAANPATTHSKEPATETPVPIQLFVRNNCPQNGTIRTGRVPSPMQGFPISFQYYLPPCYENLEEFSFPVVLIVIESYENDLTNTSKPLGMANSLILAGEIPPSIFVTVDPVVDHDFPDGLAKDLVPYIDANLRTIRAPGYRAIGGYSHCAAIAARSAFHYPEIFGAVGVLSGGINDNEIPEFEAWSRGTNPTHLPRVFIDVGVEDQIVELTKNLVHVLAENGIPYQFHHSAGNHGANFVSSLNRFYGFAAASWQSDSAAAILP